MFFFYSFTLNFLPFLQFKLSHPLGELLSSLQPTALSEMMVHCLGHTIEYLASTGEKVLLLERRYLLPNVLVFVLSFRLLEHSIEGYGSSLPEVKWNDGICWFSVACLQVAVGPMRHISLMPQIRYCTFSLDLCHEIILYAFLFELKHGFICVQRIEDCPGTALLFRVLTKRTLLAHALDIALRQEGRVMQVGAMKYRSANYWLAVPSIIIDRSNKQVAIIIK